MTGLVLMIAYPLTTGFVLGLFFFGTLLWVVRTLPRLRNPAALVPASFVLRTLIVVGTLYGLFADSWQQLLAALAGFVVARGVFLARTAGLPAGLSGNGHDI
ncbi:MAG: N-ATPase subunit AtpR [Gammaproteobacteria bacterium]|jgi:F1F0 ATPase subunit 2